MIIEAILGILKIYMKVTDEAQLAESSYSGPVNDALAVFSFASGFVALKGYDLI